MLGVWVSTMLTLAAWALILTTLLVKAQTWVVRVQAHAPEYSHVVLQALGVCCPLAFWDGVCVPHSTLALVSPTLVLRLYTARYAPPHVGSAFPAFLR